MPQTKSVIKGKPTVQDTRLSSTFLVGFRTFREKIAGLFIPQDLFKRYVPIIFPKSIEKDLDQRLCMSFLPCPCSFADVLLIVPASTSHFLSDTASVEQA